jgi:hypothetical protein
LAFSRHLGNFPIAAMPLGRTLHFPLAIGNLQFSSSFPIFPMVHILDAKGFLSYKEFIATKGFSRDQTDEEAKNPHLG